MHIISAERKTKENIIYISTRCNATMHSNLPQGAPWNEKSLCGMYSHSRIW